MGVFQHCFPERSVYQIGSVQTRTSEIGSGEISMTEIGSAEDRLIEEGTASICSRQVCATQVRSNEEGVFRRLAPLRLAPVK